MMKQIDEKVIKRIEDELNLTASMYTDLCESGYDHKADEFRAKLHGMLQIMDYIGLDYEYTDDMKMKVIEKEDK